MNWILWNKMNLGGDFSNYAQTDLFGAEYELGNQTFKVVEKKPHN